MINLVKMLQEKIFIFRKYVKVNRIKCFLAFVKYNKIKDLFFQSTPSVKI